MNNIECFDRVTVRQMFKTLPWMYLAAFLYPVVCFILVGLIMPVMLVGIVGYGLKNPVDLTLYWILISSASFICFLVAAVLSHLLCLRLAKLLRVSKTLHIFVNIIILIPLSHLEFLMFTGHHLYGEVIPFVIGLLPLYAWKRTRNGMLLLSESAHTERPRGSSAVQ